MVLDVRAQILCNLGPVISGSVKDDHVQGQGLVMTTGELVIAGLVTPAHGDVVKLAYITPDETKAARFPRGPFYVTKAYADPLRNQTQVSMADKLAYEKGKGGGVINSALVDGLNGRIPKVAKTLNLREAFTVVANRLGVQLGNVGNWSLKKQIAALASEDYVETLSDMLASVTRFGYLDTQNKLVARSYKQLPNQGPVVGFDRVIDLNGNQGGLDFTENPTGSGTAQTVEEEDEAPTTEWLAGALITSAEYGNFRATWDSSSTTTETSIKVTLRDGTTRSYPISETVETFEQKAEPDNRVIERTAVTSTSLVKVNSQVIQDHLNAGITGPSASTAITSRKTDRYTYEEIPPPPLSEQEEEQVQQEILAAQQAIADANPATDHPVMTVAGTIVLLPKLPTFRVIREESSETMSYTEALGRIGVKDYTKMGSIPTGEGTKQSIITDILYSDNKQKRIERTYVAYGLTQMGQQAISAAALKATTGAEFAPYLEQFFRLVLEDVKVVTSDLNTTDAEKPVPDYLAPYQTAEAVIQGGNRIQVGATPETRANSATGFAVPFLPDDVVNDDGSVTKGDATASAANYAEEQNRLLLGHRLGLQVTTGLGVLPTEPLAAFHLRNGGITATYRTNGTAWSFDANSCLVSTDALYWGLAGGDISGPRWTPVAPGTSALPTPPADVNNGPQDPVNSVTLVEPVDVSDSAAVTTLIDSLPDDETEVFETELTPVALALPFKPISTAALQVRLQLETLLVPLGINRSLGDATLQSVLQLEAMQEISEQVVLQLESGERQLLIQSFSAGLGLGGNLS
jgi:hypothetical protein